MTFIEIKEFVNGIQESTVKASNFTLSMTKFNFLQDVFFRILLVSTIAKATQNIEKGNYSEILELLKMRNEYNYDFIKDSAKNEIMNNKVIQDFNSVEKSKYVQTQGNIQINEVIVCRLKDNYIFTVDAIKQWLGIYGEKGYNFLFSNSIEKYLNLQEDLKKEHDEKILLIQQEKERLTVELVEKEKEKERLTIELAEQEKKKTALIQQEKELLTIELETQEKLLKVLETEAKIKKNKKNHSFLNSLFSFGKRK